MYQLENKASTAIIPAEAYLKPRRNKPPMLLNQVPEEYWNKLPTIRNATGMSYTLFQLRLELNIRKGTAMDPSVEDQKLNDLLTKKYPPRYIGRSSRASFQGQDGHAWEFYYEQQTLLTLESFFEGFRQGSIYSN